MIDVAEISEVVITGALAINAGALFAVAKAGFSIAAAYGESKVKFDLMWADFIRRGSLHRMSDPEMAHDHTKGEHANGA